MNAYYQLSTDEIFTFDYSQICGQAVGICTATRGGGAPIVFKDQLRSLIKMGLVTKLGKL